MARTVQIWRDEAPPAPMLASACELDALNLDNSSMLYEQKFDGIRAIVIVEPSHPIARVRLLSRNGNDKAAQFPEIVRALRELAAQLSGTVILDGEIVALDARGRPASFTALQSRMHLKGATDIDARSATVPTALIVFDLLREGREDLRPLPLAARRARLEHLLHVRTSERLREGVYVAGHGRSVLAQAEREDWEGLIVKDADAPYLSGVRSRTWRKVKLHKRATLVIGGWTDPKGTRSGFGALMVGRFSDARGKPARPPSPHGSGAPSPAKDSEATLCYAGNVGGGFSDAAISDLLERLRPLARTTSPFVDAPRARGQHWVAPRLLCEVRFSEWTPEGRLRHPVFLGLRDDVGMEAVDGWTTETPASPKPKGEGGLRLIRSSPEPSREGGPRPPGDSRRSALSSERGPELDVVVRQLQSLEDAGRDGALTLPDGVLEVTNPRKVFWPASGLTKGDLLRYYTRVSPWLLPVIADRPLVMKRYPNGVLGKAFYQQRAPDAVPPGVNVQVVEGDEDDDGPTPRLIGGSLLTLLYVAQLGAISLDPWFSRAASPGAADFVAIDLDPMPGVPFAQVRDVARWVREALVMLDVPAALKTSGSSGLHIYIPLAEGTSYESGQLLCQIIATAVASQHPRVATVERTVARRGRTVYVDYLQNIEGKTLACAYSARASQFAGVSTPLQWEELDQDIRPEDFTLENALTRFEQVGDLWNPVMRGTPVDLRAVIDRLGG
jgi:bifunctional non-homologous end joining protein LigD